MHSLGSHECKNARPLLIISFLPGDFGSRFANDRDLQTDGAALFGNVAHVGQLSQVTARINFREKKKYSKLLFI